MLSSAYVPVEDLMNAWERERGLSCRIDDSYTKYQRKRKGCWMEVYGAKTRLSHCAYPTSFLALYLRQKEFPKWIRIRRLFRLILCVLHLCTLRSCLIYLIIQIRLNLTFPLHAAEKAESLSLSGGHRYTSPNQVETLPIAEPYRYYQNSDPLKVQS